MDEFIYLVRKEGQENDHYHLQMVDYPAITGKKYSSYYTCSSKGFTLYANNKPVEFIEADRWLKEREVFNRTCRLSYFCNFRKFKCYKKWVKTVSGLRFRHFSEELEGKLFFSNNIYRQMIIDHRTILTQI